MSTAPVARDAILADIAIHFEKQRALAEGALAQVDDRAFFATLGEGDNSIAVIVKHMAGNLRSRFTDFLTSDGEKADRNRDGEFEIGRAESRAAVMEQWVRGWSTLLDTLRSLAPGDLGRTVFTRGEPATVQQALVRALVHQSQHAGQLALLAKHFAGDAWRTLSIARRDRR